MFLQLIPVQFICHYWIKFYSILSWFKIIYCVKQSMQKFLTLSPDIGIWDVRQVQYKLPKKYLLKTVLDRLNVIYCKTQSTNNDTAASFVFKYHFIEIQGFAINTINATVFQTTGGRTYYFFTEVSFKMQLVLTWIITDSHFKNSVLYTHALSICSVFERFIYHWDIYIRAGPILRHSLSINGDWASKCVTSQFPRLKLIPIVGLWN